MDWLIKLYESEYFIVILLSIIAFLTLLFIIVALSGRKKEKVEDSSSDLNSTVAFEETNVPSELSVPIVNEDEVLQTSIEETTFDIQPEVQNLEVEPTEVLNDVTPVEELSQVTKNESDNIFGENPSIENDFSFDAFSATPTLEQEVNVNNSLFDENPFEVTPILENVSSEVVEPVLTSFEPAPLESVPEVINNESVEPVLSEEITEEELTPVAEVNIETVYNPSIDDTKSINLNQFSSVYVDEPTIKEEEVPNAPTPPAFNPYGDIELPKPATKDEE